MTDALAPPGYELGFRLGSGGMAEVRYGRRIAGAGFSYPVAIKQLHPHLASRPEIVSMFLDEARLAARVSHPNVVPILDLVHAHDRIYAVMPYVEGEALGRLVSGARASGKRIPARIAVAIALDLLAGLGAAHAATDEEQRSLGIVHRDVSPENVLVGTDGVARVLDFGVAKARGRLHETRDGQVKGKLAYMSPEQLAGDATAGTDVYAAAIVLWELLAGRRLFDGDNEMAVVTKVMASIAEAPGVHAPVPPAVDAVVTRALSIDPGARFATAAEMIRALEEASAGDVATRDEVAAWVSAIAGDALADRRAMAAELAARPLAAREDLAGFEVPTPAGGSRARRSPASALGAIAAAGALLAMLAATGLTLGAGFASPAAAEVEPSAPDRPLIEPIPARVALTATSATHPASAAQEPRRAPAPRADTAPRAEPRTEVVAPAAPVEDCDPPYAIDASGARRYKRACIR